MIVMPDPLFRLRFDRIGEEATASLRGDARRVHDLAEQFREQYRRDLEEWMQLRARLDRRKSSMYRTSASLTRCCADAVDTPWGDRNARLVAPDGMQLTFFQVLDDGNAGQ